MTHTLFSDNRHKEKTSAFKACVYTYIYIWTCILFGESAISYGPGGHKSTGHEGRGQRAKQFLSTLVEKHPIQLVRDIHHQYPYTKIDI
jgi:hypothetical protein